MINLRYAYLYLLISFNKIILRKQIFPFAKHPHLLRWVVRQTDRHNYRRDECAVLCTHSISLFVKRESFLNLTSVIAMVKYMLVDLAFSVYCRLA